jgi:type IV fimbrial biogenesis protein FimT
MTRQTRRSIRGLTLVELMVTLGVALVLLLIATPMFTSVTTNNSLTSASNLLSVHMQLARSEAIKRGTPVTLCPSGDGATCANTTEWALGWMVFVDGSTPGAVETDQGDVIIAISPNVEGEVEVSVSHPYIRYLTDGSIELPAI